MNLNDNHHLNLLALAQFTSKPPLFEPGAVHFWDDPYIATQMFKAHLDPTTDAASRKPATIEKTVHWVMREANLQPGMRLLDLGCGPGLYTSRFAALGLRVTGIDISENSLHYAQSHDSSTTYRHGSYLELNLGENFDAIVMIYGDLCVLAEPARDHLLSKVYHALRPGGYFVFDIMPPHHQARRRNHNEWQMLRGEGFWKPAPHLVLLQTFDYPEHETTLEQYLVIEESGEVTPYRIWTHYYTLETITPLLGPQGLTVMGAFGDLTGTPLESTSNWIGIVARRLD